MKIHFEKPGFLSENIFITGGKKPGFFMSVYFKFPYVRFIPENSCPTAYYQKTC
ncbi:Uncharacterized protein dnm_061950 [Desulfonema magnum]|uniref:Uncharacterized protein n=1 Tax=Desulfonema magnum TaxID=45655 RepID=A0A975GQQ1_9BACT|nr:Uncharacterized protein dnm_061950 [Desulfonema magnum]